MDLKAITDDQESEYNKLATHVIQSWQWGNFRKLLSTKVLRYGLFEKNRLKIAFQITIHPVPYTNYTVGYLPKGPFPNHHLAKALLQVARQEKCIFIKVEPNILIEDAKQDNIDPLFKPSPKPLFTKHNILIDLTLSEDELLKNMHPKTRYNIRVAEKHGVKVEVATNDQSFNEYLRLYFETTRRQGYFGHNASYHRLAWQTLKNSDMARLLVASYQGEVITAWMLLNFHNTLYYPYGGSSQTHKHVMASNLVAWEAIKLGKKSNLKTFDLWGSLGPSPDPNDPFIGFHRFKLGYGGKLVEYIGTFDLVQNPLLYKIFNLFNHSTRLKATLLKIIGR